MTRRDLDVVIGARTDAASFKQAEAKTKSMMGRIASIGGGGAGGASALDRSNAALGKVAQVTAAVVAIKDAAAAIGGFSEIAAGHAAEARGDYEAAAAAFERGFDNLRSGAVTGPILALAEAIDEHILGNENVKDVYAKNKEINAEQAKLMAKKLANQRELTRLSKQAADADVKAFFITERARVEAAGDPTELAIYDAQRAGDAEQKRLSVIQAQLEAMEKSAEQADALLRIEQARKRVLQNTADAVQDIIDKRDADVSERVRTELQTEAMAERLHGKEGKELEKEQIKIAYEKRLKELTELRGQLDKTTDVKQRVAIGEAIWDLSDRFKDQLAAVDAEKPTKQRPVPIELPQITSGNQIGGFAQAAIAGGEFKIEQREIHKKAETQRDEQTRALRELLEIMRTTGYQAVLN